MEYCTTNSQQKLAVITLVIILCIGTSNSVDKDSFLLFSDKVAADSLDVSLSSPLLARQRREASTATSTATSTAASASTATSSAGPTTARETSAPTSAGPTPTSSTLATTPSASVETPTPGRLSTAASTADTEPPPAATDAATEDANSTATPPTTAPTGPTTPTPTPINTTVVQDNHLYYTSHVYNDPATTQPFLANFQKKFVGVEPSHNFLRNAYGRVRLFKSKFKFLFYGHYIDSVAITTAGFVYMSDFLHSHLAHSQYVAPLMARFHTWNNLSDIYHVDDGQGFWVYWKNVFLRNKEKEGPFSFYMVIHRNGTIVFAYEKLAILPIGMDDPIMKIGLSDAFYWDTTFAFSIRLRRIYRYHVVSIPPRNIVPGTVVVMTPMTTCHELDSCQKCLAGNISFSCRWCPSLGRCSSGIDRMRQEWRQQNCHRLQSSSSICYPTSPGSPSSTPSEPPRSAGDSSKRPPDRASTARPGRVTRRRHSTGMSAPAVVGVVFLVLLLVVAGATLAIWCRYAYNHPSTPSGIWLLEHRPSVLKEKLSRTFLRSDGAGDRYQVSFNNHESVA